MHYLTIDKFYPKAKRLRDVFDKRFANPLLTHADRFVWDYWHVPGEYTHLRTPAYNYFPQKLYEHFHRYLVQWGREHLGCHDVSPPWLSCYIQGCRQFPHQDVPHGPLAFVYSLTPHKRKFRGGETFISKPRTLIKPEFNRLTLFNPSLTHGVTEVKGTHDPREGRLVIHGWFVNPRPFWVGPLNVQDVQSGLDEGLGRVPFGELALENGFASYRLKITPEGKVREARVLADSFVGRETAKQLLPFLRVFRFVKRSKGTTLTLPLRIN